MNVPFVAEPSVVQSLWSKLIEELRLAEDFQVPTPTFTAQRLREMWEGEVPRVPMPNMTGIERSHILSLTTVPRPDKKAYMLKMSTGTWGTVQRLTRVSSHCDDSNWVFVEASKETPHKALLESDAWQCEGLLPPELHAGLSYEDYILLMLFRRRVLGWPPEDTSGATLLTGSESPSFAPGSDRRKSVVWGYFHGLDGLVVSDNFGTGSWIIGLGMWTKVPA